MHKTEHGANTSLPHPVHSAAGLSTDGRAGRIVAKRPKRNETKPVNHSNSISANATRPNSNTNKEQGAGRGRAVTPGPLASDGCVQASSGTPGAKLFLAYDTRGVSGERGRRRGCDRDEAGIPEAV
ncbi:hypothetical protein JHW43_009361 [Diplocarpon mali]|nr:hypothetical protein JHW43_009361 [Diplocarpon mali]